MSEQRQEYAPVVPYFSASGGSKLDQLRRKVQVGEKEVADAGDWSQRRRREQELALTRRELEAVEHDARQVQQGGTAQTLDDLVASGHYIRSGNTYLQVKPTKAPATAQPARQQHAQQYAVPTSYWETAAKA